MISSPFQSLGSLWIQRWRLSSRPVMSTRSETSAKLDGSPTGEYHKYQMIAGLGLLIEMKREARFIPGQDIVPLLSRSCRSSSTFVTSSFKASISIANMSSRKLFSGRSSRSGRLTTMPPPFEMIDTSIQCHRTHARIGTGVVDQMSSLGGEDAKLIHQPDFLTRSGERISNEAARSTDVAHSRACRLHHTLTRKMADSPMLRDRLKSVDWKFTNRLQS